MTRVSSRARLRPSPLRERGLWAGIRAADDGVGCFDRVADFVEDGVHHAASTTAAWLTLGGWVFAGLHEGFEAAQVVGDLLARFLAEQLGDASAERAGWRAVLDPDAQFGAAICR